MSLNIAKPQAGRSFATAGASARFAPHSRFNQAGLDSLRFAAKKQEEKKQEQWALIYDDNCTVCQEFALKAFSQGIEPIPIAFAKSALPDIDLPDGKTLGKSLHMVNRGTKKVLNGPDSIRQLGKSFKGFSLTALALKMTAGVMKAVGPKHSEKLAQWISDNKTTWGRVLFPNARDCGGSCGIHHGHAA